MSQEECHAAFNAWVNQEVNMYELAAIYQCSVQTIRNYMCKELEKCG